MSEDAKSIKEIFSRVVREITERSKKPPADIVIMVSRARMEWMQKVAADPTRPMHELYKDAMKYMVDATDPVA